MTMESLSEAQKGLIMIVIPLGGAIIIILYFLIKKEIVFRSSYSRKTELRTIIGPHTKSWEIESVSKDDASSWSAIITTKFTRYCVGYGMGYFHLYDLNKEGNNGESFQIAECGIAQGIRKYIELYEKNNGQPVAGDYRENVG